jgi:hypothetical protein
MSSSAVLETAKSGIDAAHMRGYKAGVARQRKAWSNWFNSLPQDLQDAIQQHRHGGDITATRQKNGSLTLKVSPATIK